ncbi:MAG: hypothetical protein SFZ23_13710 [Planctomycetota bacterium]|nr:hypothetical protein [Planctomycetota bacterium]
MTTPIAIPGSQHPSNAAPARQLAALGWLRPEQAGWLSTVARGAGLAFVAAGSESRGQTGAVAAALGCEPMDDLRAALATTEADVVLLADAGSFGSTPDDVRALAQAASRGVQVVAFEPVPASAMDLSSPAWRENAPVPRVRFVPRVRELVAARVADALPAIEPIRAASVELLGPAAMWSLGAKLFSAVDAVLAIVGDVEDVAATRAPRLPGSAGEGTLRGLTGTFAAVLRGVESRAATILVGDVEAPPRLRVTIQGERGVVELDALGASVLVGRDARPEPLGPTLSLETSPQRFDEAIGTPGTLFDVARSGGPRDATKGGDATLATGTVGGVVGEPNAWVMLLTSELRRLARGVPEAPIDVSSVLSACHALLLSARTGQAERPDVIRRAIST